MGADRVLTEALHDYADRIREEGAMGGSDPWRRWLWDRVPGWTHWADIDEAEYGGLVHGPRVPWTEARPGAARGIAYRCREWLLGRWEPDASVVCAVIWQLESLAAEVERLRKVAARRKKEVQRLQESARRANQRRRGGDGRPWIPTDSEVERVIDEYLAEQRRDLGDG